MTGTVPSSYVELLWPAQWCPHVVLPAKTLPHTSQTEASICNGKGHISPSQARITADSSHTSATVGIVIELLGEPKGKGRARTPGNGKKPYTPAVTRSHENALAIMAAQAMRGRAPLQGALRVVVLAYMSVPRSWSKRQQLRALNGIVRPTTRPDADNIVKMLDAFNKIVWRDDAQIVELGMSKHYSERPRTRIEVIPL